MKKALQLLAGLVIACGVFYLAFRGTDWSTVWTAILAVKVAPMLLAVVLATIQFPLRLPRWRLLLRNPDGSALPVAALWHAIAIGFAANNVVPRSGEVLRVVAVSRLGPAPFATALSSLAVERILDALTVVALLGLALVSTTFPNDATAIGGTATKVGIVCLIALIVAVLASRRPDISLGLARRILPSGKIGEALIHFLERVLLGVGALRDPRHALPVIGWTVLLWLMNAAALYAGMLAFSINLPFSAALVMQGLLLIGIALPSTPGYLGVFETLIVGALRLYHVDETQATAYALTYHLTTFVPITLLGAWSAVTTGVGFRAPRAP